MRLLGIDTPSVGPLDRRGELVSVHQTLLGAGVVLVECLVGPAALPPEDCFVALPLRWQGLDGSPVRAVALVEEDMAR